MAKINVEIDQNVEISKKIPCEKPVAEQLALMEAYTETHRQYTGSAKELREAACLRVLYPTLLREIEEADLFIGRMDFLPIGFGCVTSVGGVGHYCVFAKLRQFRQELPEADRPRVDALYDYWLAHDTKTLYCRDVLTDTTVGAFIDCAYPLIATARLSGMMLDYHKLMDLGIGGLRRVIETQIAAAPDNSFYTGALACLDLFVDCADYLRAMAVRHQHSVTPARRQELQTIIDSLTVIREDKPRTFHQALQLFWLYALLAGVINYGRMDDVLGPFLARDLQTGLITQEQAYQYVKSLWTMIENRRTTVNGRVIVGGRGRRNPAEADVFLRIAMQVARDCRYVEPQFTFRFDKNTPDDMMDMALDCLGAGATYPTFYNDDVNIPAVQFGMRVDEKAAEQYVPFGCTEYVIQGQSTGTPNVCMNLLKILSLVLNEGIDPMDGLNKAGGMVIPPVTAFDSFESLFACYKKLLDYYIDLSATLQMHSYQVMNEQVSFLFTSMLMDDCIARGKAVLDGGVRYLGGTNETYGNINTSDALYAIKTLVYDTKKYTITQMADAIHANFQGFAALRRDCLRCDKYGNDLDAVDAMAVAVYDHVAQGVRHSGIRAGMQYYLIVISNNQVNTEWGRQTAASADGRLAGMYMNPANNPQGGADKNGPTAMLNSLVKFNPQYHAGSVQNIKFTPRMFNQNRAAVKALFQTYFEKGGCHLMVTVVDKGILEDAVKRPELYPNLLVRVSGFSAVFVNLAPDIQQEVMSRVLYDV